MITVNGIAGVFLYSNDPQKLAEWYTRNFGLHFYSDLPDTPYMVFNHRDDSDHALRRSTVFAIMPAKKPLGPERGEYMINYRVDDLAGFLLSTPSDAVFMGLSLNGKVIRLFDQFTRPTADQKTLRLTIPVESAVPTGNYRVILRVNGQQALNSPGVTL